MLRHVFGTLTHVTHVRCPHMLLVTLAPHQKTHAQEILRIRASAIAAVLAHYAWGWAGLRTRIMHDVPAYLRSCVHT